MQNFQTCSRMPFTNNQHSRWAFDLFIVVNDEPHGHLLQFRGFVKVGNQKISCHIGNIDWWTKTHFTFVEEDRNVVFVSGGQQFERQLFLPYQVGIDELDKNSKCHFINIFNFNLVENKYVKNSSLKWKEYYTSCSQLYSIELINLHFSNQVCLTKITYKSLSNLYIIMF